MSDEEVESSLNIRLGKYVVRRLDLYNIVVEEVKVRKEGANVGQEYFVNIGYYKRLHEAFEKVLRLGIEEKSIKGIKDVSKALKDAKDELYVKLDELEKKGIK